MQRLHTRDVAALCLDLGYTHLSLPAIAETRTILPFPRSARTVTREMGDVLWPSREDASALARQRTVLGEYAFAAQYQQQQTPRGGLLFKRDWWRFYETAPPLEEIRQSWDLAFKDKNTSDFVVGLVVGRAGANYYVLDRYKARASFTDTCHAIRRVAAEYPTTQRVYVEEAANGSAVLSHLQREIPGIMGVTP
jgi:hypothetical protein